MLVFALNKAPMSDTQPSMATATYIEAGHRYISTDRLVSLLKVLELQSQFFLFLLYMEDIWV